MLWVLLIKKYMVHGLTLLIWALLFTKRQKSFPIIFPHFISSTSHLIFPSILLHITLMSHHFSVVSLPSSLLMQISQRHCCCILQIRYTNVHPLRLSCSLEFNMDICMLWRLFTPRVIGYYKCVFFFYIFASFTYKITFSNKSKSSLNTHILCKDTVFIRQLKHFQKTAY